MMANSKLEVYTYNKSVFLDYNSRETVLQLKQKLYMNENVGVPACKQRLYYFGNLLQDANSLASYNINPEKYTVVLIYDLKRQTQRSVRKKQRLRQHGSNLLDMFFNQCKPSSQLDIFTSSDGSCAHKFAKLGNYECSSEEYSTFAGYCNDRLFLNLVLAMNKHTGSVDELELAVENLVKKNHSVLYLIYENLGEFLQLCAKPMKILRKS